MTEQKVRRDRSMRRCCWYLDVDDRGFVGGVLRLVDAVLRFETSSSISIILSFSLSFSAVTLAHLVLLMCSSCSASSLSLARNVMVLWHYNTANVLCKLLMNIYANDDIACILCTALGANTSPEAIVCPYNSTSRGVLLIVQLHILLHFCNINASDSSCT